MFGLLFNDVKDTITLTGKELSAYLNLGIPEKWLNLSIKVAMMVAIMWLLNKLVTLHKLQDHQWQQYQQ